MGSNKKEEKKKKKKKKIQRKKKRRKKRRKKRKETQLMVSCNKICKNFSISKHYSSNEVLFGQVNYKSISINCAKKK